jgi:protein-disulfide isomerase
MSLRSTEFLAEVEDRYAVERWLEPLRMAVSADGFPSKGPENAPVTIVEFSDFQCPYCRVLLGTLEQVEEAYKDEVRFVFRQFPLTSIHPEAVVAARASLCANEQGKFWEMHDAMFANQRALKSDDLKATAGDLGLNGEEFAACLDSGKYIEEVMADLEAGQAVGVQGTPMIFINGRALSGAKSLEEITGIVEDELRRARR